MNKTRPKQIIFRATEEEFSKIQANIDKSGQKKQAYLLNCALNAEIKNTDGIKELIPELKRIGNNLNQVAHSLNMGKYYDYKLITQNQKELLKVWQLLKQYLQEQK